MEESPHTQVLKRNHARDALFQGSWSFLNLGCKYCTLLPTTHTHTHTFWVTQTHKSCLSLTRIHSEREIWHSHSSRSLSVSRNVVFTQPSGQRSSRLNKGLCDVSAERVSAHTPFSGRKMPEAVFLYYTLGWLSWLIKLSCLLLFTAGVLLSIITSHLIKGGPVQKMDTNSDLWSDRCLVKCTVHTIVIFPLLYRRSARDMLKHEIGRY